MHCLQGLSLPQLSASQGTTTLAVELCSPWSSVQQPQEGANIILYLSPPLCSMREPSTGDPWAQRTRGQGLPVALTVFGQHNHLLLGKSHLAHGVSEFLQHMGFHFSVSACRDRDVAAAWLNVPKPPPPPPMGVVLGPHAALPEHPAPQHPQSSGTLSSSSHPTGRGLLEGLPPTPIASLGISCAFLCFL